MRQAKLILFMVCAVLVTVPMAQADLFILGAESTTMGGGGGLVKLPGSIGDNTLDWYVGPKAGGNCFWDGPGVPTYTEIDADPSAGYGCC